METNTNATERTQKANPNAFTTSQRKNPNKAKILKQAELRGYNTYNEKLMLTGMTVSNLLQRINNRAFDDIIKNRHCAKIEKLMLEFVEKANLVLQKKA